MDQKTAASDQSRALRSSSRSYWMNRVRLRPMNNPRVGIVSGACQGPIRLFESPEEQSSIGVVGAIHTDVSSEAAGDGPSDVRKRTSNFEIWRPDEKPEDEYKTRRRYISANQAQTASSAYRDMHAGRCSEAQKSLSGQGISRRRPTQKRRQFEASWYRGKKLRSLTICAAFYGFEHS